LEEQKKRSFGQVGDSFSIFQQEVLIGGRELGWGQAFRRGHEKDERPSVTFFGI
jgi:hypothetical protein